MTSISPRFAGPQAARRRPSSRCQLDPICVRSIDQLPRCGHAVEVFVEVLRVQHPSRVLKSLEPEVLVVLVFV